MFYACLTILLLFAVMCFCVVIAIIDLETYNFGLYIVLLCIVGTMLACALCIANPNACPNPSWYNKFCLMLQEMYPVPEPSGRASPQMDGLRSRLLAMQQQGQEGGGGTADGVVVNQSSVGEDGKVQIRPESRATVAMLAPAVHIMHQVWKGMAWVADGIEEEDDEDTKNDMHELGASTSETQSEHFSMKRLSVIVESSIINEREPFQEEISSEFTSSHDVCL
ncbi:hypothetical protein L596_026099 [Steinernema carpocapsae]|uniref:Uncharacterized protein n=1 Tax=Steinernema carpocapsae TaxID=34508 RepID=A0A4U5M0D0_STECR|nr:hypothetical protein L596_026099 [Steinernema carpocapsae]